MQGNPTAEQVTNANLVPKQVLTHSTQREVRVRISEMGELEAH